MCYRKDEKEKVFVEVLQMFNVMTAESFQGNNA